MTDTRSKLVYVHEGYEYVVDPEDEEVFFSHCATEKQKQALEDRRRRRTLARPDFDNLEDKENINTAKSKPSSAKHALDSVKKSAKKATPRKVQKGRIEASPTPKRPDHSFADLSVMTCDETHTPGRFVRPIASDSPTVLESSLEDGEIRGEPFDVINESDQRSESSDAEDNASVPNEGIQSHGLENASLDSYAAVGIFEKEDNGVVMAEEVVYDRGHNAEEIRNPVNVPLCSNPGVGVLEQEEGEIFEESVIYDHETRTDAESMQLAVECENIPESDGELNSTYEVVESPKCEELEESLEKSFSEMVVQSKKKMSIVPEESGEECDESIHQNEDSPTDTTEPSSTSLKILNHVTYPDNLPVDGVKTAQTEEELAEESIHNTTPTTPNRASPRKSEVPHVTPHDLRKSLLMSTKINCSTTSETGEASVRSWEFKASSSNAAPLEASTDIMGGGSQTEEALGVTEKTCNMTTSEVLGEIDSYLSDCHANDSLVSWTSVDVNAQIESLTTNIHSLMTEDEDSDSEPLPLLHTSSTPRKDASARSLLLDFLHTPNGVLSADKDGGYLSSLSAVAIASAKKITAAIDKSSLKNEMEVPSIQITEPTPERNGSPSPVRQTATVRCRPVRLVYKDTSCNDRSFNSTADLDQSKNSSSALDSTGGSSSKIPTKSRSKMMVKNGSSSSSSGSFKSCISAQSTPFVKPTATNIPKSMKRVEEESRLKKGTPIEKPGLVASNEKVASSASRILGPGFGVKPRVVAAAKSLQFGNTPSKVAQPEVVSAKKTASVPNLPGPSSSSMPWRRPPSESKVKTAPMQRTISASKVLPVTAKRTTPQKLETPVTRLGHPLLRPSRLMSPRSARAAGQWKVTPVVPTSSTLKDKK